MHLTYPKIEGWEQIRDIPGARWDKLKSVWTIPMTSYREVVGFARQHNVDLSDELKRFQMPDFERVRTSITVNDENIVVTFPYDPQSLKKDEMKKVYGARWDRKRTCWVVPHESLPEVIGWADKFNIAVPNDLRSLADLMRVRLALAVQMSGAVVGPQVEVPGLEADLMDHQHVAVYYLSRHRRAFVADDLGLGKTLESMAAIEYLASQGEPMYPVLVICPPKLGLNWESEYNRFLPHRTVQVVAKKADLLVEPRKDVTIIGYSIISDRASDLAGFQSVILDESHAFKTPSAQRTKAAHKIADRAPEARFCVTGTPITTRPSDFAPQLKILGMMDRFGDEDAFYRNFCDLKKSRRSNYDFTGASNLEGLNFRLRALGYLRRERTDALDLPDVLQGDLLVPLESKWASEYAKAEADIVAYLVERARVIAEEMGLPVGHAMVTARMKAEAGKHLVEISTLRKLSAMGKIPAAAEWVECRIEEGEKVIIAAHHREVVDALAEQFGGLKIQGGMTTKQVEAHKKKFQETAAPVITLSMKAGSEGHTLTAARNVLFVELDWLSTVHDQTWGRAWRNGQKNNVLVMSMLGAGTLDVPHYDALGVRRRKVKAATVGGEQDAGSAVLSYLLAKAV